ncbi:Uncharacterised protein [Dorea longicatena]|nr:Uncharacterised protein [Dorea longicatena]
MDGVKNLFYLSNMRLSRKFILEQMHLEILLVSTICWTVIQRSFQKHNKDWKQYMNSLQMQKKRLESHFQKKRS